MSDDRVMLQATRVVFPSFQRGIQSRREAPSAAMASWTAVAQVVAGMRWRSEATAQT